MFYVYDLFDISSPYLLVFGDDRVRGTREQMMLQEDLVRHRARAGLAWEIFYRVVLLWILQICNLLFMNMDLFYN